MKRERNGWCSVLAAAADACSGEDGCYQCVEPGEPCCMTDMARKVFEQIALAGGPTLEQCEAIARGEILLAVPVRQEK